MIGAEADIQYADIGADTDLCGVLDNNDSTAGSVRWARARSVFDRAPIYATVGLAYGEVNNGFNSSNDVSDGWTIGGGVE